MTEFKLSRIDPISAGKIAAVLYSIFGLLFGLVYAPFIILSMAFTGEPAAIAGGLVIGLIVTVLGAVFYAISGFVMTVLLAYFYNFLAGRIGGVKFELKEV